MMRPAIYLLGAYPVWSETFVRQDLALLLRAGVPLRPAALFPGDTPRQPDWPDVRTLAPAPRVSSGPGHERGGVWLPARVRTWLSLAAHRRLRRALHAFARECGAGHVHAEFADLPALLAAAAARDLGGTYSVGVHARDVHQPRFSLRRVLGRARFVTACNRAALQALLEQCPQLGDRVHLIPHGVDLRAWPFRRRPFSPHEELRLFFAGRFVPKKGLDTLLRAAALLQGRGMPVSLALAGGGPLEGSLRQLAEGLGVGPAVSWLGVLTPEGIRQEFELADVLVVPSRVTPGGDRDGIPNIVLEAMAAGVPAAGTGAGGLVEVVSSRTGWPFPADSPEALAAVLETVAREPQEAEQRRLEARALVESEYDALRLAEVRAGLFERVLGASG